MTQVGVVTDREIPRNMRVGVLYEPKVFRVEDREVPEPGPNEVLVKVGSVGICGSDVHYYEHGRIANHVVRAPMILGHEAGGRIVSVGPGVEPARLGERVAIEPGVPCRRCHQCKEGRYNLCAEMRFFATPPVDGAFAEYVTIAADFAHPVPDSMSDDAAGLMEPLSVALWACGRVHVGPGSRVLISGAGPIGLLNLQVARALGATEVVLSDVSPERLEAAVRYGAQQVLDARTESTADLDPEFDSFIECSGAEEAVRQGIHAVRAGGRITLVGMGADDFALPVGVIQIREMTVMGSCRYANTYPTGIALAARGLVDLDSMVSARFGLEDAEEALNRSGNPNVLKLIVRPGDMP